MTQKDHVKQLMLMNFGPASASQIDRMTEEEAVIKCRAKLLGFFGPEKAKEVDNFVK